MSAPRRPLPFGGALLLAFALGACTPAAPPPEERWRMAEGERFTERFEVLGTAHNAKAGAVIETHDRRVVYLEGVAAWPPGWEGATVSARGILRKKKIIPDPLGPNGELAAGAEGEQWVLERPRAARLD